MNLKSETPKQAALRLAGYIIQKGYKLEAFHVYEDQEGNHLYWRIRLKNPQTGEKWIRPMRWNGQGYELKEPEYPKGKPLYRLNELAKNPTKPVVIVEGEWCADALQERGALATTSGSADSATKADWQPLAGRKVYLWPDYDEAGQRYVATVKDALLSLNCTVLQIDVEALNLSPKGDAVDWLLANPHASEEEVLGLPIISDDYPSPSSLKAESSYTVELVRGSDLKPEPVEWLWPDWLAAGKVHVLGGAAGTGKTSLSMIFASTISSGGLWPDEKQASKGNIVIWSGEDDPQDTLVPRLIASGADMERIFFIRGVKEGTERRPFDPAIDFKSLDQQWSQLSDIKLLIIDPIVSAVIGDSNKNAEVRRSLQPLVDFATAKRCAVLGITHFSKGTAGRDPLERLTGSLAFGALARIVFVAVKSKDKNTRLLLRAKNNIGPDGGGFYYDLFQEEIKEYPGINTSYVLWDLPVEGAAHDILNEVEVKNGSRDGALEDAKGFLINILNNGSCLQKDIKNESEGAGIAWTTIRRAKLALNIKTTKLSMKDGWAWSLPPRCSYDTEDAQQKSLGTFGKIEPLRPYSLKESDRELFNERAAIMELDGGLSRAEAEYWALADLKNNKIN